MKQKTEPISVVNDFSFCFVFALFSTAWARTKSELVFNLNVTKHGFFIFISAENQFRPLKTRNGKLILSFFRIHLCWVFFFVFSLFTLISFFLRYICQYWICYFYLWHFYRWIICQLKANVLLDRWLAHNSFVSLNEKLSRLSKQFCSRFSLFNFVLLSNKSKQFTEFNKMSISDWLFCMQRSWNEI